MIGGNALIIGGGSGICRATAITFAKEGAQGLLVADIDLDAAQKVAEESRAVATNPSFVAEAVRVDVTVPDSVRQTAALCVDRFGRIDYCVNGAGITSPAPIPIAEVDFEQFKRVQDVNVNGTFLVLNVVSATMASQKPHAVDESNPSRGLTRGSIVNVASVLSFKALPRTASYTTSKHAIVGLTRTAALDNIANDIRVNCVCPSWVDTPMVQRQCEATPGFDRLIQSQLPMGRMGAPEEISDAILFLCSSKASWVNGSSLMVDGAMSIRP